MDKYCNKIKVYSYDLFKIELKIFKIELKIFKIKFN